jgi:ATP phosphoribosyltransferase regulatory subunit
MSYQAANIPEGSRDYLFADCAVRRGIERSLSDLFEKYGYGEVILPAVEYYNTILHGGSPLPEEAMYKLTDRSGRILVLRPDITIPIARVYATKLRNRPEPQRLYCIQRVFRTGAAQSGSAAEIMQGGIELIGAGGPGADCEAICLAVKALEACGLVDFHIEIGHAGLFRALIDELGADETLSEEIRDLIEKKNFAALGDILARFGDARPALALQKLISLFGGEEILDEAETLSDADGAKECVAYLKRLMRELRGAGIGDKVLFDVGLVQHIDYYTGIVFQGYAKGAGEPVLNGGRYDSLTAAFGAPAAAVGFGVNINAAAACVKKPVMRKPDRLVVYAEGALGLALAHIAETEQGSCELSHLGDTPEAAEAAALRGIETLIVVGKSGITMKIIGGKGGRA